MSKVNILLVDDRPDGLLAMEAVLASPDYNLVTASSGEEALRHFLRDDFAVVLLDVQMPGMNGFETARLMLGSQGLKKTPIIFVTAINKEDRWVYTGYESGAVDYIFKPFDSAVLRSKVAVFCQMHRMNAELDRQGELLREAEKKEKERQLEQQEIESMRRYQTLIDAVPHVVWRATPTGRLEYANKLFYDYCGLPPRAPLGRRWASMIHPRDMAPLLRTAEEATKGSQPFEAECRLRQRFDGSYRWHLIRAVPEFDGRSGVRAWVGTCTYIHDKKLIEESRARLLKMEQAARLEAELAVKRREEAEHALVAAKNAAEEANHAKSRFLANVSHEIRTPLGIMLGFSELMLNSAMTDAERESALRTIIKNGQQLGKLLEDILDISKIEADKLEVELIPFSLTDLMSDVSTAVEFKAREKGIELRVVADTFIPKTLLGDPTRIRQILVNIMGNAVKFTDQGRVDIAVRIMAAAEAGQGRAKLAFTVEDTGIGIATEQQVRLFQEFMQADASTTRRFGGTGLGLALSKRLAKTLGGDLVLESSEVGEGSRFSFWVYVQSNGRPVQAPTEETGVSGPQGKQERLNDVRILLVDDAVDNQVLVKTRLTQAGALVAVASDGAEGMELALKGDFDIVLMDLQMPRLDGYQATRLLREKSFDRPIIALTAHAMKEERERCLSIGFDDHHCKPIDFQRIFSQIRQHIHGRPRPAKASGNSGTETAANQPPGQESLQQG